MIDLKFVVIGWCVLIGVILIAVAARIKPQR